MMRQGGARTKMIKEEPNSMLYSFDAAASQLGGISTWTLRKHAALASLKTVCIGRRRFIPAGEISRIQKEGLPSLPTAKAARQPENAREE